MYLVMILALFVVLPLASTVLDRFLRPAPATWLDLTLKWFVFWPVGVRLLTAGLSQVTRPEYTAGEIFQIHDPVVIPFIQELGFANIAMGLVALASLLVAPWRRAAALMGVVFFGAAGIRHALPGEAMNTLKLIAMVSDLYIAILLAVLLVLIWRRSRA